MIFPRAQFLDDDIGIKRIAEFLTTHGKLDLQIVGTQQTSTQKMNLLLYNYFTCILAALVIL